MDQAMRKPRGRFAPSPSGRMHLGNAWTALLAWLDIRKNGGTMVLRMEDLDPDRSRPEYASGLIEDLRWLGLDWDEGPDVGGPYAPYNQSGRTALYQAAFEKLTQSGLVYPCFCSRAELRFAASAPHAGDRETPYSGRTENRLFACGYTMRRWNSPMKHMACKSRFCSRVAASLSSGVQMVCLPINWLLSWMMQPCVSTGFYAERICWTPHRGRFIYGVGSGCSRLRFCMCRCWSAVMATVCQKGKVH